MEQLGRRVADWRASLLGKGLKVNAGKSKVMVGSSGGKMIGGVCGKGVHANSVQCTVCKKWIPKRCSGVRGDLSRVADGFRCRQCDGTIQEVDLAEVLMVDGETYECVKSFCYLGDTLDGDSGADLAATTRIRNGWMKFRELLPFLTSRVPSLEMKGQVYASCVRSSMTYGGETRPLLVDVGLKFERAEMQMIRWMCGISLKDRRTHEELRRLVGVEPITTFIISGRLRWYGHVMRKGDEDWVKKCMEYRVECRRPVGRQRKTWLESVEADMAELEIDKEDVHDRSKWRRNVNVMKRKSNPIGKQTINR